MTVYRAFSAYDGSERIIVVSDNGQQASVIADDDGWVIKSHGGPVDEIGETVIIIDDVEYNRPQKLG